MPATSADCQTAEAAAADCRNIANLNAIGRNKHLCCGVTYFTRHAAVGGLGSFCLTHCGRPKSASSSHMEANMRRIFGIATAAALTITAIAAWANVSIRSDAALKTLGPMATEA